MLNDQSIPLAHLVAALDAHCIVSISDTQGNITYFNEKFVQISQYSRDELQGKNHRLLKSGLHSIEFYDAMWTTISSGQTWHGEICNRRKDGSHYWVNSTIYPMLDANKLPIAYISIRTDITDRMQFSEELQDTNIKLQLAREQAELANQAKSNFLANMSHEIRTPLNSVIGLAQVALIDAKDSNQSKYLKYILSSGNHLLKLINDILDLSKIEAGKMIIDKRGFNFDEVIEILSSMLMHQAKAKNLELVFEVDKNIPASLQGDPIRLAQILINYTGNAIKFSNQGQIIVRVRLREESKNQCLLYCEVQDSGKGVAQEDQAMLFQTFQQLDTPNASEYGGTGLGLAISKNMAQLMGGEVGVTSQQGEGSIFWFTACLEKGEGIQAISPPPATKPANAYAAFEGASILLVDDNEFNLEVLNASLSKKGVRTIVAPNGLVALEMLKLHKVDCILMDMQMPVMNGIETTRHIRAIHALATLPIIAMTASARIEDQQSCLLAGMDDFISKPIMLDKLYATLAKWLPRRYTNKQAIEAVATHREVETAAIDLGELSNLLENDQGLVRKHAIRFLQTAEESISNLEAALALGNFQEVSALGHRTYSSARMVGARQFSDLCLALENLKPDENICRAEALITGLKVSLLQIRTDMERIIA